jgi:hypothetical protein
MRGRLLTARTKGSSVASSNGPFYPPNLRKPSARYRVINSHIFSLEVETRACIAYFLQVGNPESKREIASVWSYRHRCHDRDTGSHGANDNPRLQYHEHPGDERADIISRRLGQPDDPQCLKPWQ